MLLVQPPHIWQLTPYNTSSSAPSFAGSKSTDSPLITTLHITLRHSCSDADILSVTQFARERCAGALKLGAAGEGGEGKSELTVQVVRGAVEEDRGASVKFWEAGPMSPKVGRGEAGHGGHSHESHGGHGHSH